MQCIILDRLLEQKNAVTLVLANVPSIKQLMAMQWSTVADLVETLRLFLTVMEVMAGATYPTSSIVLPVIAGLRTMLQTSQGGLDVLHDVLIQLINDKFGDVFADDDLCVATVVDPRFKLSLIHISEPTRPY